MSDQQVPVPPPAPQAPVNVPPAPVPASNQAGGLSPQAIDLIKQFVIWNVIAGVITGVGNYLAIKWFWSSYFSTFAALGLGAGFGAGAIVSGLIVAAIGGAIGGYVVVMWWKPIIGFFSGITGGWLNSPFRLFFVVPAAISILTSLTSLASMNMYFIIAVATTVVARYVFAVNAEKAMRKNNFI